MKCKLLKLKLLPLLLAMAIIIMSCKDDDEKPKTIPEVTTKPITNLATTSATGGGEIVSDGNATLTSSGLVYSSTNATPTTADNKTEDAITDGQFTTELSNLSSGTTYHVRAYATNSVGTGYGAVIDFTTGNAAPVANSVSIAGTVEVNKILTGSYTYSDAENDPESGSTFQWYRADNDAGTNETVIVGATELTYHLQDIDEFKYVRIGITPKSSSGSTTGPEVKSAFSGPVAVRTTVTFVYNGSEVTYGIVTSSVTGRKWLDRNLGAPSMAAAYDDYANFGDLFQWGRGPDGHQLVTRDANTSASTAVNGTLDGTSSSDTPGNKFLVPSASPYDWRNPQNDNLWQGVNGTNNPCPNGWRIPIKSEWQAESMADITIGYTQLKLTQGGYRDFIDGSFALLNRGVYWSATIESGYPASFYYRTTGASESTDARALAASCRCIKD
jgi:hypothetical protein